MGLKGLEWSKFPLNTPVLLFREATFWERELEVGPRKERWVFYFRKTPIIHIFCWAANHLFCFRGFFKLSKRLADKSISTNDRPVSNHVTLICQWEANFELLSMLLQVWVEEEDLVELVLEERRGKLEASRNIIILEYTKKTTFFVCFSYTFF